MKRAALPVAEEEGIEGARTLGEVAYRRLHADIVMVRLEPDQPLRFDALKAHYGLGVSPLREALSRLAEERLVTTVGQRGFRVAPMSLDEMWEMTRLRQEARGRGDARLDRQGRRALGSRPDGRSASSFEGTGTAHRRSPGRGLGPPASRIP